MQSVRIPNERAEAFWQRVFALTREFAQLPREGDTNYTFVAGLYPSNRPSLPRATEPNPESSPGG